MKLRLPTLAVSAAVGVLLATCTYVLAQEDNVIRATSITRARPDLGDLSHALNVRKLVGTYQLSDTASEVRLKLYFYQNGRLDESQTVSANLGSGPDVLLGESGEFAVQIVDLDYLPLGEAKPKHHRLYIELTAGIMRTARNVDVPKSVFDVTTKFGAQQFHAESGGPNEEPLFAIIGGDGSGISSGHSPKSTVQENPDGDVLIGVLEFE